MKGMLGEWVMSLVGNKHSFLDLPKPLVTHCFIEPVVRRIASALQGPAEVVNWTHRAMGWFDRWSAHRLRAVEVDPVVCYENSALRTFRAARQKGYITILDAASFHHVWQDRFFDYPEREQVHRRITDRKDREIALADAIITVSEQARASYIDQGVAPSRVFSIPMGCNYEFFSETQTHRSSSAPFTFIFAGRVGRRKGTDLLVEAADRLHQKRNQFQVWIAGSGRVNTEGRSYIKQLGHLSRSDLAERFAQAHCLVLPSRHDAFGRVVVEAMAAGRPVILSDHVGAQEVLEEGETGWVVEAENVKALTQRMAWCIDHPDQLVRMGSAAREAAKKYTWERYRQDVSDYILDLI